MLALKITYIVGILILAKFESGCVKGEERIFMTTPITEATEEIAYEKLRNMEKSMKEGIGKAMDQALASLMNSEGSNTSIDLSAPCMGSILKTVAAMKKMKIWPFEMLDATGKPGGGFFRGNAAAYGSYQECIDIVIPGFTKKSKTDAGQYCVVQMYPPLPPKPPRLKIHENPFKHINATFKTEFMTYVRDTIGMTYTTALRWGICVPSTCTTNDLTQVFDLLSKSSGMHAELLRCEVKEPVKFTTLQIAILSLLLLIALINIASTAYHEITILMDKKSSKKPTKNFWTTVSSVFSMRQNFLQLMETRESKNRSLDSLHGVRVIATTWIVLCHTYYVNDFTMLRELINIIRYAEDFFMQVISNGFLAVSAFIFLTGTIFAYNIVKEVDAGKKFNPLIVIVRRIWRLLPSLALTVAFIFLTPLLASGPIFKEMTGYFVKYCEINWWRTLTFTMNLFSMREGCVPHTWYLSVDMQCLLVGLVYFLILFKTKIGGALYLFLLATVANCAIGYVTSVNDYPPRLNYRIVDVDFFNEYFDVAYIKPYIYFSVYTTGLSLGTFLARNPAVKINKCVAVLGWMAAIAVALVVMYGTHKWNLGEPYTKLEAIAYSSMHRNAWALALAWLTLACFAGKAGIINDILSWPGFQPLSRLSYLVYLLHYMVLSTFAASLQGPQDYTHNTIIFNFFGCLCISNMLAAIVRVMFEYPLVKMDKMFFEWLTSRAMNDAPANKMADTAIPIEKIGAKNDDERDEGYDNETLEGDDEQDKTPVNNGDGIVIVKDKLNEMETGLERQNENEAAQNETNQILNNKDNEETVTKF